MIRRFGRAFCNCINAFALADVFLDVSRLEVKINDEWMCGLHELYPIRQRVKCDISLFE